jgi:hypothetical protein
LAHRARIINQDIYTTVPVSTEFDTSPNGRVVSDIALHNIGSCALFPQGMRNIIY